MSKWCYNYDSGEYEYIDEDGYSWGQGEYVYNVDDSEYQREREKEEAKTFASEMKQKTTAITKKIVADGELKKKQIIEEAKADANAFLAILAKYKEAPEATIIAFTKQLAESMEHVREKYILSTDGDSNSEVRIKINREPAPKKGDSADGKEAAE